MSSVLQLEPEHWVIRNYVMALVDSKDEPVDWMELRDAFVPVYLMMIPPGDDVPEFHLVHRHDSVDEMRKKNARNYNKLYRAIAGGVAFPICYRLPLIAALEVLKPGLGVGLRKALLRNAGLMHMVLDVAGSAEFLYAEILQAFSTANAHLVSDINDDGRLNGKQTEEALLSSIEVHKAALKQVRENMVKDKERGNE